MPTKSKMNWRDAILRFEAAKENGGDGGATPPSDPAGAGATPPATKPTVEELTAELERAKAALSKANGESAERRRKLNELEEAERKRQADQESAEKERLEKQQEFQELYKAEQAKATELASKLGELQEQTRINAIRTAIKDAATAAKFTDPADAASFIAMDAIDIDADGKPTNVQTLIDELAKAKPYLLAEHEPTPGNARRPAPAGVGKKQLDDQIHEGNQARIKQMF